MYYCKLAPSLVFFILLTLVSTQNPDSNRCGSTSSCSLPKMTIVHLKNENRKMYLPEAIAVHRCSDLIGCCPHPNQTCSEYESDEITVTVHSKKPSQRKWRVEQVTIFNHTSCRCKEGSSEKHQVMYANQMDSYRMYYKIYN